MEYSNSVNTYTNNKISKCQDIEQEKVNCYILSFGAQGCAYAINNSDSSLGERIAVSTACTYAIKNSLASEYVPADFALTVFDGITESSCKKLIEGKANFFEGIFAVGACVGVAGSTELKYDMAKNCVEKIKQRCE